MSKKYKEELNKIVMNEEMKKRILNNVLNENSQIKRKKYHLRKIHMQIAAACFLALICFSAAKNFMQQNRSLPKQISQDAYDKNKDLHSKEQSKNNHNEESNNSVQEHQNIEQHDNIGTKSPKNKLQENTNCNNKLEANENLPDKKEGNLRNSETNIQANENVKNSDNVKNDKGTTQEEAEDAVKFKINTIKVLPDKFNIDNISVISEEIIQIEYNNGKDTINF